MNRRWHWPSFAAGLLAASVAWSVAGPYRPAVTVSLAAPAPPEPPLILPDAGDDGAGHWHPIREHQTWPQPYRTASDAP